jgi:hypothetical protein
VACGHVILIHASWTACEKKPTIITGTRQAKKADSQTANGRREKGFHA